MSKYLGIVIGVITVLLGLKGLTAWRVDLLTVLRGSLPAIFILGGAIAVIAGLSEIKELSQLDLDKSGTLDPSELERLRNKNIKLNFGDKLLELLSTHPNMLKRIKALSTYKP